eukprot:1159528-Pelagomonas_calceolata.AAC.6
MSVHPQTLSQQLSQQRDMGRLDEILVLNEQGSRLVIGGPKSAEPTVQRALTTPESGTELCAAPAAHTIALVSAGA